MMRQFMPRVGYVLRMEWPITDVVDTEQNLIGSPNEASVQGFAPFLPLLS
jgi:hypothetical protein